MLRPVWEVRGAKKHPKNEDLDPENQRCGNGKVFVVVINSEKERERIEKEKTGQVG